MLLTPHSRIGKGDQLFVEDEIVEDVVVVEVLLVTKDWFLYQAFDMRTVSVVSTFGETCAPKRPWSTTRRFASWITVSSSTEKRSLFDMLFTLWCVRIPGDFTLMVEGVFTVRKDFVSTGVEEVLHAVLIVEGWGIIVLLQN
jgi:hypothetical protein